MQKGQQDWKSLDFPTCSCVSVCWIATVDNHKIFSRLKDIFGPSVKHINGFKPNWRRRKKLSSQRVAFRSILSDFLLRFSSKYTDVLLRSFEGIRHYMPPLSLWHTSYISLYHENELTVSSSLNKIESSIGDIRLWMPLLN